MPRSMPIRYRADTGGSYHTDLERRVIARSVGFASRRVSLLVIAMASPSPAPRRLRRTPRRLTSPTPASPARASPMPASSEGEPSMPLPEPAVPTIVASACDAREAEELRAHLVTERRRATTWNRVWRWTFTAAAVGSLGVGLANPVPALQRRPVRQRWQGGHRRRRALDRSAQASTCPGRTRIPAPTSPRCARRSAPTRRRRRASSSWATSAASRSTSVARRSSVPRLVRGCRALGRRRLSGRPAQQVLDAARKLAPRSRRAWTIAVTPIVADGTGWFAQAGGAF